MNLHNMSYISWCWHSACDSRTHTLCNRRVCLTRSIVGSNIYTCFRFYYCKKYSKKITRQSEFAYVRLDRDELPNIYDELDTHTGQIRGVVCIILREKDFKLLISHGKMSHVCKQISDTNDNFTFADILKSK